LHFLALGGNVVSEVNENDRRSLVGLGEEKTKRYIRTDEYSIPTMTAVLAVLRANVLDHRQSNFKVEEIMNQSKDLLDLIIAENFHTNSSKEAAACLWYLVSYGELRMEGDRSLTVTSELEKELLETV
jgi:hypothetical protein